VAVAFALITYFHVLLGELVPKTVALQQAETSGAGCGCADGSFPDSGPSVFCFLPDGRLVSFLGCFGSRGLREGRQFIRLNELKLIVTASRRFGQIPEFQEDMIHRVLELDSLTAREVMVPRPDIFSLPASLLLEEGTKARQRRASFAHSSLRSPAWAQNKLLVCFYARDLMRLDEVKGEFCLRGIPPPRAWGR